MTVTRDSSTANGSATRVRMRPPRRFLAWSASGATAIAAALVLALFFFSSSTSVSFAEMLAAVASRPWVHGTTTYSDGQRSATSESWVSTEGRTAAIKFGDHRQFEDIETGVSLQYDAKDGMIYRLPMLRLGMGRYTEAH